MCGFLGFLQGWPSAPLQLFGPLHLGSLHLGSVWIKIYQLTPNAFVQSSKFFLAVPTFGGRVHVDSFVRYYKLHPQPWILLVHSALEECEALLVVTVAKTVFVGPERLVQLL